MDIKYGNTSVDSVKLNQDIGALMNFAQERAWTLDYFQFIAERISDVDVENVTTYKDLERLAAQAQVTQS